MLYSGSTQHSDIANCSAPRRSLVSSAIIKYQSAARTSASSFSTTACTLIQPIHLQCHVIYILLSLAKPPGQEHLHLDI